MKSIAQLRFYRAIWAELCKSPGLAGLSKTELEARRRELHAQFGLPHSSKDFTLADLTHWNRSTQHLRTASAKPAQSRSEKGDTRRQAIWRIRTDANLANFPETYLNKVAYDRFSTLLWEDLTGDDLLHFRNLIHSRASKALGYDTRTAKPPEAKPGDDNIPF